MMDRKNYFFSFDRDMTLTLRNLDLDLQKTIIFSANFREIQVYRSKDQVKYDMLLI